MSNPFEDADAQYLVLVNDEAQYSLWPVFAEVPAGWTIAREAGGRDESLAFVEENWTDMRPKSLVDLMDRDS
ncbi:MbtH family protein [Streptomyces sp. NPDC051569]|uniref:MbtH family protein n=1 Tax=Streptomyces sp. NPDC051569 TaxID=3365661 RepID=UPI0037972C89